MRKTNSRSLVKACTILLTALAPILVASAFTQTAGSPPRPQGCGRVSTKFGEDRCAGISFAGEVSGGRDFQRKFGHLLFRLNSQAAASGWSIELIPEQARADNEEYVWVVTPPYHFWNIRYLDTSYGIKAEDAVKDTPREFNFVLSKEQYDQAVAMVDKAISSHSLDEHKSKEQFEKEGQEAAELLFALPASKGRLDILDSRVNSSAGTDGLGAIDWLKFKVELRVPCDFAINDSADISVDRTKCERKRK